VSEEILEKIISKPYMEEVLSFINKKTKRECELEDKIIHTSYWSAGFEVDYVFLKIKCKEGDVTLYAPVAYVMRDGNQIYIRQYTVKEAVSKALNALAK